MATVMDAPVKVMTTTPSPTITTAVRLEQIEGQPYLFSVTQFEQMVTHGILTKSDKVELLEGCVTQKMTVNPPHLYVLESLIEWLSPLLIHRRRWFPQGPIHLGDSVPEPDITICKGPRSQYRMAHLTAVDIELIIEISDSSLPLDRLEKNRIYARAGIPTYWIVNIPDRAIEIYTDPAPTATEPIYRMMRTIRENEMLALMLDGAEVGQILVKDLLP